MTSKDDGTPDDDMPGNDYLTDGLIHLEDTSFDFEDYFKRLKADELSEDELAEYPARVMGLYCQKISANKVPPDWVLKYFAREFYKILAGGAWNDSFPLPWNPASPVELLSRTEQEAFDIFADVSWCIKDNPGAKVTEVIQVVADKRHISYEKARAAWYKHKAKMKAF